MKGSFEELLRFIVSLSPSNITFNFNSDTIYADYPKEPSISIEEIWERFGLEKGEKLEFRGRKYDGSKFVSSFYMGFSLRIKRLSSHRTLIRLFAVLYDLADVVTVEGRRRRAYKGNFKERGKLHLNGWTYVDIPGGGMFYSTAVKGTKRLALTPGGLYKLDFPKGYNVLVRVYEEIGNWKDFVKFSVKSDTLAFMSQSEGASKAGNYIIKIVGDELLIVHERRATFRILYERFLQSKMRTRRLLMPLTLDNIKPEVLRSLRSLGFVFKGKELVEVPAFLKIVDPKAVYKVVEEISGTEKREILALKVARILSGYSSLRGNDLVIDLMLCNNPYQDPDGNVIVRRITPQEIEELLQ